jgi:hypothetical protein
MDGVLRCKTRILRRPISEGNPLLENSRFFGAKRGHLS